MRNAPRPAAPASPAAARPQPPVDTSKSGLVLLLVFILAVIMVTPDSFDYSVEAQRGNHSQGSMFTQLLWLTLLGTSFLLIVGRLQQAKELLKNVNIFLLVFCVLAMASMMWSINPAITLKRMFRVSIIMMVSMSVALYGWRPATLQTVLRPVVTTLLAASILFVLAFPDIGIESLKQAELVGAWKGIMTQKNALGAMSSIAAILWMHGLLTPRSNKVAAAFGIAIAMVCLFQSRSSTSIMATAFAWVLMVLLMKTSPALRRYMPYIVGLFVGVILVYSLAVLHLVSGLDFVLKPVTMITGKDATFSGRTAIWAIINDHIAYAPKLGSGYGAYWTGVDPSTPSFQMMQKLFFYPTEGHNGYLDIINDLGAVGGAVLIGYLLLYVRQALRLMKTDVNQGSLYLVLLFEQLIANMSESMWLNVLSIEFVIMTLATVCLGRALQEQKRAQSAPAAAPVAMAQPALARRAPPGFRPGMPGRRHR